VLATNVHGAAATLTAVLPRMVQRGRGRLAGVGSLASRRGLGGYSGYNSSKAFLSMFMECLRIDLRGTGVTATCIEPGFVATAMTEKPLRRGRFRRVAGAEVGIRILQSTAAIIVPGCSDRPAHIAFGCGSFMTEEDRVKRPHFTSLSRGFGIGFGATPSA
jgi:NAD(P)-dependent dehydrogenase (short-subunit alcohol dehydrogenase family)